MMIDISAESSPNIVGLLKDYLLFDFTYKGIVLLVLGAIFVYLVIRK